MLGCTKQHISYWEKHSYSTQSRKSIYRIIKNAADLFDLNEYETEALAESAGLFLCPKGGDLLKNLQYSGKYKHLCDNAMVSERMLRHYKNKTPTKQALLAIAVVLEMNTEEINELLHKYGYSLSGSIEADVVLKWYIENSFISGNELLFQINETLQEMELPLLMTRINF